jgi:hypothetical protein
MSHSRAERRRSTRGSSAPPPKRDPMMRIYVGLAVVVVLIFAGFGISNWLTNRARAQAFAFDTSTPSPAPAPTGKPIALKDLQPIGAPTGFPQPNLAKNILTDTKQGGQGQTVDGIPCQANEQAVLHVHSHLTIVDNAKLVQVPAYIGMAIAPTGACLYWMHTHGPDGIIHIEAGDATPLTGGPYTLGAFFDIWGEPLGTSQVGPFKGPVTAYVNGTQYNGDPRRIPLRAHQDVTLEIGQPIPPPNYVIPPND